MRFVERLWWIAGGGLIVGCAAGGPAWEVAATALDCERRAVKLELTAREGDRREWTAECLEFQQPPPVTVTCTRGRCAPAEPCKACLEERRKDLGQPPPRGTLDAASRAPMD